MDVQKGAKKKGRKGKKKAKDPENSDGDSNEDDEEAHSKRDRDNAQDPSETEPILLSEPELGRTSVLHIR